MKIILEYLIFDTTFELLGIVPTWLQISHYTLKDLILKKSFFFDLMYFNRLYFKS